MLQNHCKTPNKLWIPGILLLTTLLLVFFNLYLINDNFENTSNEPVHVLGKQVRIQDIKYFLSSLSLIGTKFLSSEGNTKALYFLKQETDKIIKNVPNNSAFHIESDIFLANGSFNLTIIGRKTNILYEKLPTIIIKIKPKNKTLSNYCLFSSHYDSVVGSPGASDNLFYTSLLLYSVKYFSDFTKSDIPNVHCNLLYAFSGAEEAAMSGAHAFTTQHPLRNNISLLINFDSPGGGDYGVIFQATENAGEILKTYKKYSYKPGASVIAEEIFKYATLPADTDFQIYQAFGKYAAIDLLLTGNGHQYHNRHDTIDNIKPYVFTKETRNILSFIYGLITNNKISKLNNESENYVYFDVFGKFMVLYSEKSAFYINTLLIIMWLIVYKNFSSFKTNRMGTSLKSVFMTSAIKLVAILCSLIANILLSILMYNFNYLHFYNTYFIVAAILYGISSELVYVRVVYFLMDKIHNNDLFLKTARKEELYMFSTIFDGSILVAFGTYMITVRSIYLYTIMTFILILSKIVWYMLSKSGFTYETTKIFYVLAHMLLSFFMLSYLSTALPLLYSSFITLSDRLPCMVPSETLIAVLSTISALIYFNLINFLMFSIRKSFKIIRTILLLVWLVCMALILLKYIPVYQDSTAAKRMSFYHNMNSQYKNNEQTSQPKGSIVVMATDQRCSFDYGDQFNKNFKSLRDSDRFYHSSNQFTLISEFESSLFYCDYEKPVIANSTLKLVRTNLGSSGESSIMNFELSGNQIIMMDIVLPKGLHLKKWSFDFPTTANGVNNLGELIYNIIFFRGYSYPLKFWLEFEKKNMRASGFYITVNKHYLDLEIDHKNITILKDVPSFVAPVGYVTERQDHEFDI